MHCILNRHGICFWAMVMIVRRRGDRSSFFHQISSMHAKRYQLYFGYALFYFHPIGHMLYVMCYFIFIQLFRPFIAFIECCFRAFLVLLTFFVISISNSILQHIRIVFGQYLFLVIISFQFNCLSNFQYFFSYCLLFLIFVSFVMVVILCCFFFCIRIEVFRQCILIQFSQNSERFRILFVLLKFCVVCSFVFESKCLDNVF